jgi:hypothetical protein
VLEPNDLSALQDLVRAVCDGEAGKAPKAVMAFFKRVFGALGPDDKQFFQRLLSNKRQRVCAPISGPSAKNTERA